MNSNMGNKEDYQAIIQAIDEQNAQEIVTKINNGEMVDLTDNKGDFLFMKETNILA